MARVYSHILQSHGPIVQRSHYIRERLGELKELIKAATNEKEFWETWLEGLGAPIPADCENWVRNRVDKLGERIRTDRGEQEVMEKLLASLIPCRECNGLGELRHVIDVDTSKYERCPNCNGTGTART